MLKLQAIGVNSSATRMNRVVDFYSKVLHSFIPPPLLLSCAGSDPRKAMTDCVYAQLPKGALPKKSAGVNPIARYRQAYFEGPEASAAPIGHLIVVLFLVGYTIDCAFPLHSRFPPLGTTLGTTLRWGLR